MQTNFFAIKRALKIKIFKKRDYFYLSSSDEKYTVGCVVNCYSFDFFYTKL